MTWDVDKVEMVVAVQAVAAVLGAVVAAGQVAWVVPRQPDQVATVFAPVVVTKCLTRRDSHAIR